MRRPGAIWRELFANLGRKPVTVTYPKEPMVLPANFRGRPVYDPKTCIGCKLCERDCPARVITISKVADKTFACTFRLDRCIYCGQCADICPKKSITMSHTYEMATFDRNSLTETTAGEPPLAPESPVSPAAPSSAVSAPSPSQEGASAAPAPSISGGADTKDAAG